MRASTPELQRNDTKLQTKQGWQWCQGRKRTCSPVGMTAREGRGHHSWMMKSEADVLLHETAAMPFTDGADQP